MPFRLDSIKGICPCRLTGLSMFTWEQTLVKWGKLSNHSYPDFRDMKKFVIMKSGDIYRYTKINNICRAKSSLLRHFIGSQNISLKKKNRWSFKGLQSIYTKKRACSAYVVKYLRYNYSSNWILNLHAGYANMRPSCVCAALG